MKDKGKITTLQAVLLFLIMVYSATMRAIPGYTINEAGQAAWLTPAVSILFFIMLVMIVKQFVTKYPNQSFADVTSKIMGRPLGKIIIVAYILWFLILLSLYVRFFDERLLSSIYPKADIKLFIIILLIVVGVVLRSGIVVLARMNKLIFAVVILQFTTIVLLMIKNVELCHLTPISQLDIVPVFKGTVGVMGIWVYFFFIFMISDKIMTSKDMHKNSVFSIIFSFVVSTVVIILVLGVFGMETVVQIPLPFLIAIKNISKEYSGLESLFISLWILADFIAISLFAYIIIRLLKSLFGLKDPMPLLSILLIFTFFLSLFLCNEVFELQAFSEKLGLPMNVIMGLVLPFIIFVTGKIRKKL